MPIHPWRTGLLALTAAALLATGCASNRSLGEQIDDATLTSRVKARLAADPEVSALDIDVDTEAGVVRLSGIVEDRAAAKEAVKLTRRTNGVRRVIDDLRVGERTFADRVDDAAIVTTLNTRLARDPEVGFLSIDVDSRDGVVTLSGTVESRTAKDEAEKLARGVDGVRKVVNRLRVETDR